MCSCVGRAGLTRLAQCANTSTLVGAKSWFLRAAPVQRVESRGHRTRQQTGMAGHVSPYVRIPFFHDRGPGVGIDKTLQERLDELDTTRSEEKVNIGFKSDVERSSDVEAVSQWRRESRKNRALEKAAREGTLQVDLELVRQEWKNSGAVYWDIYKAAELYGIYEDLFRHGYFIPCVDLNVAYGLEDDLLAPVYRGNVVKPREAVQAPEVSWASSDTELWCLVLTGLDGHMTQDGQEYLHWMVGNIRGCDLTSGEQVASYLQPFPAFGTGFHRFAFILYKQDRPLDFSYLPTNQETDIDLEARTFNTFNFYSRHQDDLTPAGLAFFQSDYDTSLRDFFHNTLQMKEPRYEYEFPLPYIKSWTQPFTPEVEQGFNDFLDKHRDPKDLEKEVLIKKLKHTNPYHGDTEVFKYPLAHEEELKESLPTPIGQKALNTRQSFKIPAWRRLAIMKERSKKGYFESTDHAELRRDPPLSEAQ